MKISSGLSNAKIQLNEFYSGYKTKPVEIISSGFYLKTKFLFFNLILFYFNYFNYFNYFIKNILFTRVKVPLSIL